MHEAHPNHPDEHRDQLKAVRVFGAIALSVCLLAQKDKIADLFGCQIKTLAPVVRTADTRNAGDQVTADDARIVLNDTEDASRSTDGDISQRNESEDQDHDGVRFQAE